MAPVEFATIAENAHGSAFEVKIKRSGSTKMTAAQQRLESYATQPRPAKNTGTLRCEQLADKAKKQNEQKKEVVNKLRMDRTQSADTKRIDLVQHLEKAEELRKGTLSNRKERAAQHYEKVMKKMGETQQKVLMAAAEAKQRLMNALTQKETLRAKALSEIKKRATQHNQKVELKVQEQKKVMETKSQQSKDLPAAERLTDLSVRLYEHHMVAFPGGA